MPPAKIDLTDFQGLVTSPGLLMRANASCNLVRNFDFPAPGVIRKTPGFALFETQQVQSVWKMFSDAALFASEPLKHVSAAASLIPNRLQVGTSDLFTVDQSGLAPLSRPAPGPRMQMAACQRNHYVTADLHVARIESDLSEAVRYAGMPRGMGASTAPVLINATVNPLGNGIARDYRITWHCLDANDSELGGAPTARVTVANASYVSGYSAGAARAARVVFSIPREYDTNVGFFPDKYFFRAWATKTYTDGELGGDEMYLVQERYPSPAESLADAVTVDDLTPDSFLTGAPTLHTNTTNFPDAEVGILQGVSNADDPPPQANDIAYFQNVMFFADYLYPATLSLAMIGNAVDGDTVTLTMYSIASGPIITVLTARNAPATSLDFQINSTAPSVTLRIRETVRDFVRVVNSQFGGDFLRAYHTSNTASSPGVVDIYTAEAGTWSPTITFSASSRWQLNNGYQEGTQLDAQRVTNGLAFSKSTRADAVPPVNVLSVGPGTCTILRLFEHRDRMYIFTNAGIYTLTGSNYDDFSVQPFDLGFTLLARDSIALCDEKIYAWCKEGIIEISDGGVTVISTPIEPTLDNIYVTAGTAKVSIFAFAVAYRSRHQVRFHYPYVGTSSLHGCGDWLSFDTRTRMWSHGDFGLTVWPDLFRDNYLSGCVMVFDDLLALGRETPVTGAPAAGYFLVKETPASSPAAFIMAHARGDGASEAVSSRIDFQFQVPDDAGLQHWQQTDINWDAGELSWRPAPTFFTLNYFTERNETIGEGALAEPQAPATAYVTRIETPRGSRRAQRLKLSLLHSQIEYMGIVGVAQSYRSGAKFARQVMP